jgi:zinc protease
VVISGYLHAGSLYEANEQPGLANFTASALLRGAGERSFQEIYTALESSGARLRIDSGTHTTAFGGQSLAEDIGLLLEILAEALRFPNFPCEQVERLRSQILAGLAIQAQDTEAMAQQTFDQLIYAGHPYSRPEEGIPETVRAFQREELAAFQRRVFGPRGMVIVIVGAIEPGQAVDLVDQYLGDWVNPEQPSPPYLPPVKPLETFTIRQVAIPGKSQADLALGTAGPRRADPDFVAANLGNSVLGQFGMMGRLGERVREKAGLAYSIQSSLGGGLGPGPWYVLAGVDPENVQQAIELIRFELRRFTSKPVSKQELADVKEEFIGSLPLSLESNAGVAAALVNLERHQLGLDYYRNYATMLRQVNREEVLQAARHYLDPERLGVAVAGPEMDG